MASSYYPKIVTSGLVMYADAANRVSHPGSGTVWTDLIRRNSGNYQNSPTFSSDYGGTVNLSGTNAYVYFASNTNYNFGTGDFAVESWVWMNSINGGTTPFVQSDALGSSTADKWWFGLFSSGLYLAKHSGGGSVYCSWSPSINTWYHIIGSRTSSTFSLYINGVSQTVQGSITNTTMGQNGISVGAITTPVYLNGKVSIVKLYNKGLNSSEAAQNFAAHRGRFGV